ncbi:MAG TPA: HEPN domain-containing protein [Thermoanaerobaculia bacterium]|nr:HEPN domain-containing protein [Thermoanaerobaculia bacterium]
MNPEIVDLWKRALQALQTSESLVESDPDAASSRAYYASFYAVSALLALQGQGFTKHTAVERAVHRDLVKPGLWPVEVGSAFSWLANLRYTGDYGGQQHVLPEDARLAVERARLILETVRRTAPEPLVDFEASQ